VLEPWAFAWLAALVENGGDVWAAARAAAARTGCDRDAIDAAVLASLPSAAASGYIAASRLPERRRVWQPANPICRDPST
jgi:hypothetical protein